MCSPYQTFTKGLDLSKAPDIIHSHSVIGVLLMSLVGFHASACRIQQQCSMQQGACHMQHVSYVSQLSSLKLQSLAC